jgi:hypothetical protein
MLILTIFLYPFVSNPMEINYSTLYQYINENAVTGLSTLELKLLADTIIYYTIIYAIYLVVKEKRKKISENCSKV